MEVLISTAARNDLRAIARYIAVDNPTMAAKFVSVLETGCLELTEHPLRYALLPNLEGLGYRRRPLGNYAIIYAAGRDIKIVLVLHSAMDMASLLYS